jgi:gas vesicle protein
MRQTDKSTGQPRRTFLAGVLAGVGGAAALLSAPKRARAAAKTPTVPAQGPILYRRTKEAERYYKTLY